MKAKLFAGRAIPLIIAFLSFHAEVLAQWSQVGLADSTVDYLSLGPGGSLLAAVRTSDFPLWHHVYGSTDGGESWTGLDEGLPENYKVSLVFSDTTTTLYAGLQDGLYRLRTGETEWMRVLDYSPHCGFATSSGIVFAGVSDIHRSTDWGDTWEPLPGTGGGEAVTGIIGSLTGRIIASLWTLRSGDWFIVSDDNGLTWTERHASGAPFLHGMGSSPSGSLFGVSYEGDLYRSVDNGWSWVLRGSLDGSFSRPMAFDVEGVIYSSTHSSVYRSTDEGSTWIDISANLADTSTWQCLVLHPEGHLYVGEGIGSPPGQGNGVWKTDGPVTSVNELAGNEVIPRAPMLSQNYPNPFNAISNFEFRISNLEEVTLKIYDILGREVATIVNEKLAPGTHMWQWDASGMASGVYVYRMRAGDHVISQKLLLIR